MSTKSIEIMSYQYYQFSTREDGAKAVCTCAGTDGWTVYIYFHEGAQALNAASKSGKNYYVYYRYSDMSNIIDMLRNEKPVFLHYVPEGTNNTRLSTTSEPVGEGEQS